VIPHPAAVVAGPSFRPPPGHFGCGSHRETFPHVDQPRLLGIARCNSTQSSANYTQQQLTVIACGPRIS